ncbi:MAG: Bug family tripartite tricarboxylate transporter substrate binding protein, partial [Hylemonella sp.]
MRFLNPQIFIFLTLALSWLGATAQAQEFPSKPLKIYVGQGAGGGMDNLARIVAQRLSGQLGQPVIVENKVGAGGIIATDFVAKSAP